MAYGIEPCGYRELTVNPIPHHGSAARMKTNILCRRTTVSLAQVISVGAIGLLAGCATAPESHVVSAPPPPPPMTQPAPVVYTTIPAQPATTTVVSTPSGTYAVPSPATASSVVVMQAPPQAQQEIPTVRPSGSHAWVPGYWTWRNNRYEWVPGHWEIPPRSGGVWIPPRWQPEGRSFRFFEGYWD